MSSSPKSRTTPLFFLACKAIRPSLAATLLLAALSPAGAYGETAVRQQWDCRPSADGAHWLCSENSVPGAPYQRPPGAARSATDPLDNIPSVSTPRNLDWVTFDQLTPEQQAAARSGCCGAYLEPPRDYPEGDLPPEQATLEVGAATTQIQQDNIAHLYGNVQVTQGRRQIRSDEAHVDRDQRQIELTSNVIYREPGMLMLGDQAHADLDRNRVTAQGATFVVHGSGIRGTASQLQRDDDGMIYVDDVTYTACEPGNNAWRLRAADMDLDTEDGWGSARHVRLEVKNTPIIYLPWVRFPIDDRRTTGVLFPSWEISEANGLDVALPTYLNLAPNYDATLTPRYLSERGEMVELEARHLTGRSYTVFSGGYLRDDDGGARDRDLDPDTGFAKYQNSSRGIIRLRHNGGMGAAWATRADYTEVSDNDFFRDLGATTLEISSQTHLRQLAGAGYQLNNWHFDFEGRKYQTIIDNEPKQYQLMPRVQANGQYRFGRFTTQLKHQLTHFEHDDSRLVTGQRARIDYGTSWNRRWTWGYFRPGVKIKHLSYDLSHPSGSLRNDNPNVTVPIATIDSGIFFERQTQHFGDFTQTLEPRLFYLYSPYEDQSDLPDFDTSQSTFSYQQLFRDDRFVGGDRIGDADQVSIGITTRFISQSTGIERFRASIGQAFYLAKRRVNLNPHLNEHTLRNPELLPLSGNPVLTNADRLLLDEYEELRRNRSDYAAEAFLRLSEAWRLQADVLWDPDNDRRSKSGASLRYRDQDNRVFNLGYRYTREQPVTIGDVVLNRDIEQAEISAFWPLFTSSFSLIARWHHDLTNSRELETYAGLEYNSCCWSLALVARRWIDRDDQLLIPDDQLEYDQGIFFQLQLKGLAGLGSTLEKILSEGIYGYEPRTR